MAYNIEIRQEVCSSASKLVRVKITRLEPDNDADSCISGFECNSETSSCRSRCLYRLLLETD
ncbi:MAG: hypothetical protein M0Z55_02145 [Peptococcaceae bacterium]|nr:hypothetical protein [Peptococcaceae bacterium]